MNLTHALRNESFEQIKPNLGPRHQEVLDALRKHPGGVTAWELSKITNRMIHTVRPRLTELRDVGKAKVVGKRYHEETQRSEAVWAIETEFKFTDWGQGEFL